MDFWEWFFILLIYVPLIMIWAFALVDIFRRDDMNGLMKAVWVLIVFLIPFIGTLIYLIFRPVGATKEERVMIDQASRDFVQRYETSDGASQLSKLADLHDRGKLTDAEFATEKARILSSGGSAGMSPAL
ncbi:MAG: SHOCT domain-containing protein [Dehalococcoidia bacterium]